MTLRIGDCSYGKSIHPKQPVNRPTTSTPHLMYTNWCDSCDFANWPCDGWPMLFVVFVAFDFIACLRRSTDSLFVRVVYLFLGFSPNKLPALLTNNQKYLRRLPPIVIPIYYSYYLSSFVTDFSVSLPQTHNIFNVVNNNRSALDLTYFRYFYIKNSAKIDFGPSPVEVNRK